LPLMEDLGLFLAVIKRASLLVAGDSGPVHFAAGLGVPVVVLYGPTSVERWAPVGRAELLAPPHGCVCPPSAHICSSENHCLAAISSERVFQSIKKLSSRTSETDSAEARLT
jgi:ADP-heptose:LPS heptosyltransferase